MSTGMGLGLDAVFGENRAFWIYQNKSWFGLALGLNLN